ncbi:MAG: pitrilysin family protein [bacterium]
MQEYKEYFLSNGIKVLYFNFPFMRSTEVKMFLKGGALFEADNQVGLSHFLEHILFAGTKKYPNRLDLTEAIKKTGGSINGNTSRDAWHYPIKVTDKYIDLSFEVLAELLQNGLIKNEDIEHEKRIITEELQRLIDRPSEYLGWSLMPQTIFENVALKRQIEVEINNISKITPAMVSDFYHTFYNANNMLLTVCSSQPIENILTKAEKNLGSIKRGLQPQQLNETSPVLNRVIFKARDIKQINFSFGTETFGINDSREYQSRITAHILSSLLFEKLREEKGLTYSANAFTRFYSNTGAIFSIIATDKEKIIETLQTTLECFDLLKNSISDKYFDKAKNVILSNLLFEEEKPSPFAYNIAYQALYKNKVQTSKDKTNIINSITKDDISNLSKQYFVKEKIGFSFLGNIDDKLKSEIKKLL